MKPISNYRSSACATLQSIFVINAEMYLLTEDSSVVCIEPCWCGYVLTNEPCVEVIEFSFDVKDALGSEPLHGECFNIDVKDLDDLIAMCKSVGVEFTLNGYYLPQVVS